MLGSLVPRNPAARGFKQPPSSMLNVEEKASFLVTKTTHVLWP